MPDVDADSNGISDCLESCQGDFNGDGLVDGTDLAQLFQAWGNPGAPRISLVTASSTARIWATCCWRGGGANKGVDLGRLRGATIATSRRIGGGENRTTSGA